MAANQSPAYWQKTRKNSNDKFKIVKRHTLESGIDVGQGISVGPGKFAKKNKHRALNTHALCSK